MAEEMETSGASGEPAPVLPEAAGEPAPIAPDTATGPADPAQPQGADATPPAPTADSQPSPPAAGDAPAPTGPTEAPAATEGGTLTSQPQAPAADAPAPDVENAPPAVSPAPVAPPRPQSGRPADPPPGPPPEMPRVGQPGVTILIRHGLMRTVGQFRHDLPTPPVPGTKVVIRTDRGVELGDVVTSLATECSYRCTTPDGLGQFLRACAGAYPLRTEGTVMRLANPQDLIDFRHLHSGAREEAAFCRQQIRELGLKMRVVTVEHTLGGERILFYFTSEIRIDFRELVRRLAAQYRTRIEMRQVGARDEARVAADYERCGQRCCCQQYLKELQPVSMRMAKVQKATLDPSKISGRCGRLMCCLRYEDLNYDELRKKLPRKNTWVRTADRVGRVIDTQIITQLVRLELPDRTTLAVACEEIVERDVPAPEMAPLPEPGERRGPSNRRPPQSGDREGGPRQWPKAGPVGQGPAESARQAPAAPEGQALGAPEGQALGAPEGQTTGAPSGQARPAPDGQASAAPGGQPRPAPMGQRQGAGGRYPDRGNRPGGNRPGGNRPDVYRGGPPRGGQPRAGSYSTDAGPRREPSEPAQPPSPPAAEGQSPAEANAPQGPTPEEIIAAAPDMPFLTLSAAEGPDAPGAGAPGPAAPALSAAEGPDAVASELAASPAQTPGADAPPAAGEGEALDAADQDVLSQAASSPGAPAAAPAAPPPGQAPAVRTPQGPGQQQGGDSEHGHRRRRRGRHRHH